MKALDSLRRELRKAVFPIVYFLAVFHLLALTRGLLLEANQVTTGNAAVATIMALLVAKAVLVVDALGWSRPARGRALWIVVVERAVVYGLIGLVFRALEELLPRWWHAGSLATAWGDLTAELSWPRFWGLQLWMLVSLAVYAAITALDEHLGRGSLRRAFLGPASTDAPREAPGDA